MDKSINFPNLGIYLSNVGDKITLFGFDITYYGITIAIGMLCGIFIAMKIAKKTNQDPDNYLDLALVAIVSALVGARIFYVVFSWEEYKDHLLSILNIRKGGLAIYGGVIGAVICTYVFSKKKKLNFGQLVDTGSVGLVLGQIIGRWGNFFNREVFGEYTNNLLAMQLPLNAVRKGDVTAEMLENIEVIEGISYIQVHPTFLYESLWNLGVFIILICFTRKCINPSKSTGKGRKRFRGEVFTLYLLCYGIGRFWIERLRTDQLLIPLIEIPVSVVLSVILVIVAVGTILIKSKKGNLQEDKNDNIYGEDGRFEDPN